MRSRHWIIFGARDEADKSILAYKDKGGTYMLKVLQNKDGLNYDFGDKVGADLEDLKEEITGEYTTLMFAGKNGKKSIEVLIETLETIKGWMELDERKSSPSSSADPYDLERLKPMLEEAAKKQREIEARPSTNTDLYVRDKYSGDIHRIGDNRHDMLTIDKNGQLHYMNLQNGDGCNTIVDGLVHDYGYEFVPNTDDYGYNMNPREENENANG